MKVSALQSYFTYPVILIEYWAKWLIRSLQGTVCLILFWNVCLHKCHTRKSLEAAIICNVKIFQFLWSFPSPEGSNSSPRVDKSSWKHPPPALVPSRNMTLFLSRHADKWWIRLSPRKCCSSFLKAHCCLNNSAFPTASDCMPAFTSQECKSYGLDPTRRRLSECYPASTYKKRGLESGPAPARLFPMRFPFVSMQQSQLVLTPCTPGTPK